MRVDKVARQSERRVNKTTQLEVKTLKTANHRKKGADHLCRFFTSSNFMGFISVIAVQLPFNKVS